MLPYHLRTGNRRPISEGSRPLSDTAGHPCTLTLSETSAAVPTLRLPAALTQARCVQGSDAVPAAQHDLHASHLHHRILGRRGAQCLHQQRECHVMMGAATHVR